MPKNKNDKRYVKAEGELRENFLKEAEEKSSFEMCSKAVSKRAGLHESTFHRHYKGVVLLKISRRIQKDLIREYAEMLGRVARQTNSFNELIRGTLIFVAGRRKKILVLEKVGGVGIFEKMAEKLWEHVRRTEYREGMERIKAVYKYEVIGLVKYWMVTEKCDEGKIELYVREIGKLSSNGLSRLSFLAEGERGDKKPRK